MLPRAFHNEQDMRKWQIDTLKIFNDRVVEVKEGSEYRVDFTAGGKNMSLNVILGNDFPSERPIIQLSPIVPHLWLAENSNQVVGAPGLMNYTVHSDLGRVVQAIIREFQRSLPNLPCNEEVGVNNGVSPQHQAACVQSLMFPELGDLTIEELQEILENQDIQDKLLENSPQLSDIDLETEELICNIEQIAQDNLDKQKTLDTLKTDVIERITTIVQMKMSYEELNNKYQSLSEIYDPHRIRDYLREAALKADEHAESIAEQFLLGNVPVETFIAKFAENRALGQARRAREERLAHQLAQLDKATC